MPEFDDEFLQHARNAGLVEHIVKKHDEVYWGSFYKVPAHRLVSQGITDNHELPQCKLGG